MLSSIASNDEITPPLYFALAWLSLQIDSSPEFIRLPSLIAGTVTIPLIYLLGTRTVNRAAGLVAALVMALSPFMIYYSSDGRSYALLIALLTASTLALLVALETRRARWWVVYAVCSCGALYSHYTAVFPLAAQFAWVLWLHREAIRPLLVANLGVVVGFAPWLPEFVADNNSPTTDILSSLQPFTFDQVTLALGTWAVGYPYVDLDEAPGPVAWALIAAGVLAAAVFGGIRAWRWLRRAGLGVGPALERIPAGIALVVMLGLATPVGEAVYSALGSDVLGARSLNAGWPGLALGIGALVTAAGGWAAVACGALVLSGFAIGAAKTLGPDTARFDYAGVAEAIQDRWAPGDVVIDGAWISPVPLTGLDVYLPQTHPEFRLRLPVADEPFQIGDRVPRASAQIDRALEAARGHSIFLVAYLPEDDRLTEASQGVAGLGGTDAAEVLRRLPPHFEATGRESFDGLLPLVLITIEDRGERR